MQRIRQNKKKKGKRTPPRIVFIVSLAVERRSVWGGCHLNRMTRCPPNCITSHSNGSLKNAIVLRIPLCGEGTEFSK
ncbi:hypothetical protein CEXT_227081 [Caerostris extrusa]|uniref:Uncharacterized protein n=1 Tax=Caerostris extrusa TaxID=172846 RepID=A0AAV4NDQ2_CAEEX|nr:hypothetical protein CEXT_227081 [Caerostris extrusa]